MPTEPLPPLMEMALQLCNPHKDQSLHLAPTEMPGGNGLPVTLEFRRGGIPWPSWLIRLAQSVSSSFMETTRRSQLDRGSREYPPSWQFQTPAYSAIFMLLLSTSCSL